MGATEHIPNGWEPVIREGLTRMNLRAVLGPADFETTVNSVSNAVAAAVLVEREACAKIVDATRNEMLRYSVESKDSMERAIFASEAEMMLGLASDIRARGEK